MHDPMLSKNKEEPMYKVKPKDKVVIRLDYNKDGYLIRSRIDNGSVQYQTNGDNCERLMQYAMPESEVGEHTHGLWVTLIKSLVHNHVSKAHIMKHGLYLISMQIDNRHADSLNKAIGNVQSALNQSNPSLEKYYMEVNKESYDLLSEKIDNQILNSFSFEFPDIDITFSSDTLASERLLTIAVPHGFISNTYFHVEQDFYKNRAKVVESVMEKMEIENLELQSDIIQLIEFMMALHIKHMMIRGSQVLSMIRADGHEASHDPVDDAEKRHKWINKMSEISEMISEINAPDGDGEGEEDDSDQEWPQFDLCDMRISFSVDGSYAEANVGRAVYSAHMDGSDELRKMCEQVAGNCLTGAEAMYFKLFLSAFSDLITTIAESKSIDQFHIQKNSVIGVQRNSSSETSLEEAVDFVNDVFLRTVGKYLR